MGKQRYRSMHPNMLGMLKGKTVISVTEYNYLISSKPEIKNIHLEDLASDRHILFQKIDDDNYNHNYINDMFNLIFT